MYSGRYSEKAVMNSMEPVFNAGRQRARLRPSCYCFPTSLFETGNQEMTMTLYARALSIHPSIHPFSHFAIHLLCRALLIFFSLEA